MMPTRPDLDESARLILMDDCPGLVVFTRRMRDAHPGDKSITVNIVSSLWRKYRGFDGRTLPTHDIETGERIR